MKHLKYVIGLMLTTSWLSMEVSVVTRETTSISSCGWLELVVECTPISKKRTMSVDMATGLITWFFRPCKPVWCTSWVTIVLGRWILSMGSPRDMIMWGMPIQGTRISSCTISRKLLLPRGGLSGFTREIRGLTVRPSSWSKQVTIRDIYLKKASIKIWWMSTVMGRRSGNDEWWNILI